MYYTLNRSAQMFDAYILISVLLILSNNNMFISHMYSMNGYRFSIIDFKCQEPVIYIDCILYLINGSI